MKKISLSIVPVLFFALFGFSQKTAYVDTEYILSKIPAYENAENKINEISKGWEKEIQDKYTVIEKKYKEYLAEQVLLSAEMKDKRKNEIFQLEEEANKLREKYFGDEGELYQKRKELVKPIQDDVYNAIKEIATEGNYGFIFDKSSGVTILYTDSKFDISDEVLKKLGY